jgi:hypothetical protein
MQEYAGNYPSQVSVVSFGFKQQRFEQHHRAALRFPMANFRFSGVDPESDKFDMDAAKKGVSSLQEGMRPTPGSSGTEWIWGPRME